MKWTLAFIATLLATYPVFAGGPYLKTYADPCGINVGTAVVWSAFNSGPAIYRTTLENNFNLVEPENEMKWGELRPNQATFNYTKADTLIAWAQPRGMKIRGHVLAWHQDNPGWLTGGGFNSAQLSTLLQTHITTVMNHFEGDVYAWDVVNEAFNEDGSIRSSIWSNSPGIGLPGTQWIEQCFIWARAADPAAKLYYNDYNNELTGYAKGDAVYNMAVDFVNRGVPIDGIGMQVHIVAGSGWPSPAAVRNQINRITALGLDVEITELDVRIQLPTDAGKLAAQAATAQAIIDACLDNPRCRTIQWWGHTDNYSWVPATFPGYGDALLLDTAYNPKPVYNTFLNELNRPCLTTPTRTPLAGSPTRTPTLSPTPQGDLIDDFEDLNTSNLWGGNWSTYADAGTTLTATVAGPGAPGSALGRMQLSGTIASYGGLTGTFSGSPRNLSQYVGIQFEVRGSGNYWFQAAQTSIADGDHHGLSFTATAGWTTVTLLFANFDQRGFGAAVPFDLTQITMFQWGSLAAGAFNLEIDNPRVLYYGALPTRTPTLTGTRSPTPASSPTRTPSPTLTSTGSFSRTASPTATRSITPSPGASSSSTPSPTRTLSSSPQSTPSASATATRSATPTPPSTPSLSPTQTPTRTVSPLASPTFSPTVSGSYTVSPLSTPSHSPSATRSHTHTPFPSPSASPSDSPSVSSTRSLTPSMTPSSTVSPLASASHSPSSSASPTATASPSGTLTASRTATLTQTPTGSGTLTASPSISQTRTATPNASPTSTPTPTSTPSFSPTLTATSQASASASSTRTPSPSPASSASPTPVSSPSWTAIPDAGSPEVEEVLASPNPNPSAFHVKVKGRVAKVRVKVYSTALTLLHAAEGPGSQGAGWVQVPLGRLGLPNGTYYIAAEAEEAGAWSGRCRPGKFSILY